MFESLQEWSPLGGDIRNKRIPVRIGSDMSVRNACGNAIYILFPKVVVIWADMSLVKDVMDTVS